ncbi:MAG: response regulator transcription factor [Bacteroidales bacterium]|nr:response regulator transcription factor [Bacteroidales bacterium]
MATNIDSSKYKILLVDDEEDILEFLAYNLRKVGYEVYTAEDGIKGIKKAKEVIPDLIVLDVMMPNMDGIEACEILNGIEELKHTIKIFLTARGEDYSQIAGFDAGADDYVEKPIKPKVLVSRINALLRRREKSISKDDNDNSHIVNLNNLSIDTERYIVVRKGVEHTLPRKEFKLLLLLTSKPEKVFTREEILEKVWGNDVIVGDRTIDVHIRKLRDKLKLKRIITVKGIGYKFIEKYEK